MAVLIWGLGVIGRHWVDLIGGRIRVKGWDIRAEAREEAGRQSAYPIEIPENISLAYDRGFFDDVGVVIVCVPTLWDFEKKEPIVTAVKDSAKELAKYVKPDTLVILESTVPIGTTDKHFAPELIRAGAEVGYIPERYDPGRCREHPPLICAGTSIATRQRVEDFVKRIGLVPVPAESIRHAEAAKLLENAYRLVNIAWACNVAFELRENHGLDYHEVARLAATKPYGYKAFNPAMGAGGHCIPITPRFLGDLGGIDEAATIDRIDHIADRVMRNVAETERVLILGSAYKPDVRDESYSPSLALYKELETMGIFVDIDDVYEHGATPTPISKRVKSGKYKAAILAVPHRHYLSDDQLTDNFEIVLDPCGVLPPGGKVVRV